MLTKEEKEKLDSWSKTPIKDRKYTRDIFELILKDVFKDYKNPTEKMSVKDAEEFNKLIKKEV
jgi:hypothetical protein